MAVSSLKRLTISDEAGESIDFELWVDEDGEVIFAIETQDGETFELTSEETDALFSLVKQATREFDLAEIAEFEDECDDPSCSGCF